MGNPGVCDCEIKRQGPRDVDKTMILELWVVGSVYCFFLLKLLAILKEAMILGGVYNWQS